MNRNNTCPIRDLILQENWCKVEQRLRTHPMEAMMEDEKGRMALHYLCSLRPNNNPVDNVNTKTTTTTDESVIMSKLLQTFIGAAWSQDDFGWTPLSLACCSLRFEAARMRQLIEASRVAVTMPTNCGMTPLYLACWSGAGVELIQMLLEAGPTIATWPTLVGDTPIYLLWNEHQHTIRQNPQCDAWVKLEMCLKAANYGTISDVTLKQLGRKWRLVHTAASISTPPLLFQYALEREPNQVSEKDEFGRLPLILAVSARVHSSRCKDNDDDDDDSDDDSDYILEEDTSDIDDNDNEGSSHHDDDHNLREAAAFDEELSVIDQLVKAYPIAARIPDMNGRLPLALALESGKEWDKGVKSLFEAAPMAVTSRDVGTLMYPFMLAAIGQKSRIDNVFELLRAAPQLIHRISSCSNDSDEIMYSSSSSCNNYSRPSKRAKGC